jgi:SAM-dependent methyltransferase
MIAYARARFRRLGLQRRARLFLGDLTDGGDGLPPRSIDFAFLLQNSLRHLEADAPLRAHLAQVARLLKPGGVYAVGISLTEYGAEMPAEDLWIGVRGRCRVLQLVNYLPPPSRGPCARRERMISHLMIERPSGTEHRDHVYDLRCYSEAQWLRLLRCSALRRIAVLDASGKPRENRTLPYQYEVLGHR